MATWSNWNGKYLSHKTTSCENNIGLLYLLKLIIVINILTQCINIITYIKYNLITA